MGALPEDHTMYLLLSDYALGRIVCFMFVSALHLLWIELWATAHWPGGLSTVPPPLVFYYYYYYYYCLPLVGHGHHCGSRCIAPFIILLLYFYTGLSLSPVIRLRALYYYCTPCALCCGCWGWCTDACMLLSHVFMLSRRPASSLLLFTWGCILFTFISYYYFCCFVRTDHPVHVCM